MNPQPYDPFKAAKVHDEIGWESWLYSTAKPGKAPPADSRNRPGLARLWDAAYSRFMNRQGIHTFVYFGKRYGIVFLGRQMCVLDITTREVLVKPPTSMSALRSIVNPHQEPA